MSDKHEVHQLVIRNMAVLEQAPAIVEEAEKRIFGAIDRKVEEWASAQKGWDGIYDFLESETTVKPAIWPTDEKDTWPACFSLNMLHGEGYKYRLSGLVHADGKEFGIRFVVGALWITNTEGRKYVTANKIWKEFLKTQFDNIPTFAQNGFRVEGDELFHPIRLDPAILADAYPDTLADALEPVDEALAHLAAALPEFDRLIEAAQAHFGRQAIEATPPG